MKLSDVKKLGAALSLGHLIVLYEWAFDDRFAATALGDPFAICWPFFQSCAVYRSFLSSALPVLLALYGFTAILALAFYLLPKLSRFAAPMLGVATIFKLGIFLGDMRFMGNYHYMLWWFSFAFLFLPKKQVLLPTLLVVFYFFAGLLKLNQEWLSGAALLRRPMLDGPMLGVSLYYVLLLELFIIPLILFFPKLRWFVVIQLFLFHAFSWHIVGYLYPLLMGCMLVVFLDPVPHWRELWRGSRVPLAFLGLFMCFQLPPLLIAGDSSITGEGRLASLNMLDAKVGCVNSLEISFGSVHNETHDALLGLEPRIRCDPYVHYQWALQQCDRGAAQFRLYSKKESDLVFQRMIDLKNFCANPPVYRWWAKNDWIAPTTIAEDFRRVEPPTVVSEPQLVDGVLRGHGAKEWSYQAELSGYPGWLLSNKESDGIVPFIPGSDRILGIDVSDGVSRWLVPLPGTVRFAPAASSGKILYVITQRFDLTEHLTAVKLREGRALYSIQLPFSVVSFELATDRSVIAKTVTGTRYQISAKGWEAL